MTGSGEDSTPVDNRVALSAIGAAGEAVPCAAGGLVFNGLNVVLMPGGNDVGAALVALVDADVAVFAHRLGVTLDVGSAEGGGCAVGKCHRTGLGEDLGVHRIDALLRGNDPVGILAQSVVRIPCTDRDRSDGEFVAASLGHVL